MVKAERLAQDTHSRLRAHTTCSWRTMVTSGYHELLHQRLLKPLQLGSARECAAGLAAHGLTRDFFTDSAPVLRQPLQLDDAYKKIDGRLSTTSCRSSRALCSRLRRRR